MRLPLFLALLLAAAGAHAADYTARAGSTLGFEGNYQGESFKGRFARFTPSIRFDPQDLAGARFDVRIQVASASTGDPDYDGEMLGASFLDSVASPEARYVATTFRALGGNRYVAEGELTLRGNTRKVPLTFTWTAGDAPVLEGEAVIRRLEFDVGGGDWADTEVIRDEVKVTTRLVLGPVG